MTAFSDTQRPGPQVCVGTHRHDPDRPRSATEGLLCAGCASRLSGALAELPGLWDSLEEVLAGEWNERVTDDRWPLAVAEHALPLKPAVAEHRRDIAQQLASWARLVAEEMGQYPPVPDVGRIVGWLGDRQEWVFAQPWVDDYAHEVLALRGRAKSLLDTGRRGWVFLGPCMVHTDGSGTCQVDVYAPEDSLHVTCVGCGIEHEVAERREWLREQARDYLATAEEAADFASKFHGREIKPDTVRKWSQRGHLATHGRNADGVYLFRVEDVVLHAGQFGQRRAG